MPSKPQFVGEKVRLGELIKSSGARNRDGNYADVYSITNSKGFIPSGEYFSKEVYSKELSAYKLVSRNMIAYNPSRINVGSVGVQDKANTAIVSPLYVVFSTDATRLIPAYLVRFLKSKSGLNQIAFQSIGTVRNNLKFDALCRMEIVLPSLETQNERLGLLGLIEDKIDLCNQQIAALSDLVKSRFVEMFGDPVNSNKWPRYKIGDVYAVKSSKRIYAKKQTRTGIPFYRLADINTLIDNGHANSKIYISEDTYAELASNDQVPLSGDILVTARGTLGRCYVIAPSDCFYFQDGMITWLSRKEVSPLPTYLVSVFKNAHFIDSLRASCSGTTVRYLSIFDLANTTIPLPPIALQEEFVDFVSCADKSRFISISRYRDILIKRMDADIHTYKALIDRDSPN